MSRPLAYSLTLIMFCMVGVRLFAQTPQWLSVADSILGSHYNDSIIYSRIDSNYVCRPQGRWTFKTRLNISGATFDAIGTDSHSGYRQHMHMPTDIKSTLSASVTYMGISAGISINPKLLVGKYKDYELNLNSYGNKLGIDVILHKSKSDGGWVKALDPIDNKELYIQDISNSKTATLNTNIYWALNSRRFSMPAAFNMTYIQKKSTGSVLLGLSYQGQETEANTENTRWNYHAHNIGVGVGYGYNMVVRRDWLIHLSSIPTFMVYTDSKASIEGQDMKLKNKFPRVILTGRGSVIRYDGNKFYGLSMVYTYTSIGKHSQLHISSDKWRIRLIYGWRL